MNASRLSLSAGQLALIIRLAFPVNSARKVIGMVASEMALRPASCSTVQQFRL